MPDSMAAGKPPISRQWLTGLCWLLDVAGT